MSLIFLRPRQTKAIVSDAGFRLILALTGVLLVLDLAPGYDVFQLLMNGKEEIILAQMVGG
jgi:hypothetical protein